MFDTIDPSTIQPGNVGYYGDEDGAWSVVRLLGKNGVQLRHAGGETKTIPWSETKDQNWLWYLS